MTFHFMRTILVNGQFYDQVALDAESVPAAKKVCREYLGRQVKLHQGKLVTLELHKRPGWTLRGPTDNLGDLIGRITAVDRVDKKAQWSKA